jgi:hypothetical protein
LIWRDSISRNYKRQRATNDSQVKITNTSVALENLDDDMEINRALETMRENIISTKEGLGYYELKKRKPWLDKIVFRTSTSK